MRANKKILTILVAGLLLGACASPDGETDTDNNDVSTEGGGELNIAWQSQPPTFDPIISTANATRDLMRNVYEPLVTLDGEGQVQPVIAESFDMSDDGTLVTFSIRSDITFHDGESLTVEDILASFDRWKRLSNIGKEYFADAEASSSEDGVVEIALAEPLANAPLLMAEQNQPLVVMREALLKDAPDSGIEEHIGTGPYVFDDWVTDQFARFTKFEGYSSPEGEPSGTAGEKTPYFDTLTYHIVPDSATRVAGLQTGEYDVAIMIPQDNAEYFEDDDDFHLEVSITGLSYLVLNSQEGPLEDPLVRQAVAAALDSESILHAAFVDEEYYTESGAILPEDHAWYSPVTDELRENTDKDVVQELLDEAGYDGEEIRILAASDYDGLYDTAIMVQQQLEEAGIATDLFVTDYPTIESMLNDLDSWDMTTQMTNWRVFPSAYHFLADSFPGLLQSDALDDSMHRIVFAEDDEEMRSAITDMTDVFLEDIPDIKFGDYANITGMSSDLKGYENTPYTGSILYNMRRSE